MHAGAREAATRMGLGIFWNAPQSETNYAQQALMLEDVIRQKVDGIVLAPSHGSVLASAVRHAKAENIPLVVVDSPVTVDADEYLAYIGSDPENMGELAALRCGKVLDGPCEIAILGVSPKVEAAVQRERAFARVMTSRFPEIRIVEVRYGLSDHVRSREIVNDILDAHSSLNALFASDPFATRGALIAVRARKGCRMKLIGVAQETDLLNYVEQALIDSLVVQDPYAMGHSAVEILGEALGNGYKGPRRIQTRIAIASRDNVHTAAIQDLVSVRANLALTARPGSR